MDDFAPALGHLVPRLRTSGPLRAGLDAVAALPGASPLAARLGALAAAGAHPDESLRAVAEWRGLPAAASALLAADPALVVEVVPRLAGALVRMGLDPQAIVTAAERGGGPARGAAGAPPPFDLPALLSYVVTEARRVMAVYAAAGAAVVSSVAPACPMCTLRNDGGAAACAACGHVLATGAAAAAGGGGGDGGCSVTREGVLHVRKALREAHRDALGARSCTHCGAAPIRGARYVCTTCPFAVLCDACYTRRAHECAMQRIAPLTAAELAAAGSAAR